MKYFCLWSISIVTASCHHSFVFNIATQQLTDCYKTLGLTGLLHRQISCSAKFHRHLYIESALENNEMKKWSWGAASEQQMTGKNKTRSGVNILFYVAHKLFSSLQWSSLLYKIQQFMYIVHNIHKWQKLDIICIQQMIYSMRTST